MSSIFDKQKTLQCRGQLVDLETPRVMGILNVTPDSFYLPEEKQVVSGEDIRKEKVIQQVEQMVDEGIDILDVGGVSTRPGADLLDKDTEYQRVVPVIQLINERFPDLIMSVDTFRSEVAEAAVEAGAAIVNDVSAGQLDEQMFETVGRLGVPYVMMHMKGTPADMQDNPQYDDVVQAVMDFFLERVEELKRQGVNDIIVDPGFGFGKTLEHNYELLQNLDYFGSLGVPVLVGMSRKSMINKLLKTSPEKALNGTTVVNTLALLKGADILRVHDVREARETIKIMDYYTHLI